MTSPQRTTNGLGTWAAALMLLTVMVAIWNPGNLLGHDFGGDDDEKVLDLVLHTTYDRALLKVTIRSNVRGVVLQRDKIITDAWAMEYHVPRGENITAELTGIINVSSTAPIDVFTLACTIGENGHTMVHDTKRTATKRPYAQVFCKHTAINA